VRLLRAAAVQLTSTADLDANLEAADRLTRAAARDGAELIVLPEKWPALGPPDVVASGAQDLETGPAVTWGARRRT
jgi:nitrilase